MRLPPQVHQRPVDPRTCWPITACKVRLGSPTEKKVRLQLVAGLTIIRSLRNLSFFPPSHHCRAPSRSSGHLHLPLLPPSANLGARDPKLTAVSIFLFFFYPIRGLARGATGRILPSSISRAEISECRSEPAPIFSSYLYPNTNTSVHCSCHESAIRYNGSHPLNIAYVLSSFPHRHARLLPTVLLASSQSVRHTRS